MSRQAKKTLAQHRRIFALGTKLGCGVEELREMAENEFGDSSLSNLTFDQANHLIKRLGGYPFPSRVQSAPRRTVQHQRQKAGIPSIVSPTHIDFMRKLWRTVEGRTDPGLEALTRKILGHAKPRTGAECNKVIEAIKSMNRRARQTKEAA